MATNVQRAAASARANDRLELGRARRERPRIIDRSTVYALLTVGILVLYAASAVVLRALLPDDVPYAIALLATGAGALLALPLRDRLQRTVDQVMYGDRNDPYLAITRLGTQLEASVEPEAVPGVVVETVASALRLPYVAIELEDGAGRPAASIGRRPADLSPADILRLPLVHRGSTIGWLVLAPRSARERFDDADLRLLDGLARQAGPALEAARLTADLRRSRLRLITAREEERRRLRRDLHDGLGPTLAGTLMKMEAARATLGDRPGDAQHLLGELAAGTRRAIEEVRRVTYDLRPPALDELGLVGALREQAAAFAGGPAGGPQIEIRVPATLPGLPAAVEVAAYRISLEALTNAMRHSGAHRAMLEIATHGDALLVEVADDGRGLEGASAGVGLRSMRERAEELGGSLLVETAQAGGTHVRAILPMRDPG